jgi:hypothetical protein
MTDEPVVTSELIARHRRLARELRNAAIREAMRDVMQAFSGGPGLSWTSRICALLLPAKPLR